MSRWREHGCARCGGPLFRGRCLACAPQAPRLIVAVLERSLRTPGFKADARPVQAGARDA